MVNPSPPFDIPSPSIFESGFTHVIRTFVAVKNFLTPAVVFLAKRVQETWNLLEPYVQALGIILSTRLGIGLACLGIALLPISLAQTIPNKLVAAITLAGGIALAVTGGYLLGTVGVLPAFVTQIV